MSWLTFWSGLDAKAEEPTRERVQALGWKLTNSKSQKWRAVRYDHALPPIPYNWDIGTVSAFTPGKLVEAIERIEKEIREYHEVSWQWGEGV